MMILIKCMTALKARSDRDYLFFKLAIHSGMKITELLTITVKDTKRLIEKGTLSELCKAHYHSLIKIRLPETLSNELLHYIENKSLSNEDVLFQSLRTNQVLSSNKPIVLFIKQQLRLA